MRVATPLSYHGRKKLSRQVDRAPAAAYNASGNVPRSCRVLDTRFMRRGVMKVHRACLFAVAALGAVVLFGCTSMPATKFDQAKDLQKEGKYAEAIKLYRDFIAEGEYPSIRASAQYEIARSYRSLNRVSDAREAYKKVMDLYPTSQEAQWAKEELKELDKMVETAPGAAEPMHRPSPPTPR
jgi:TolA-binding protein